MPKLFNEWEDFQKAEGIKLTSEKLISHKE